MEVGNSRFQNVEQNTFFALQTWPRHKPILHTNLNNMLGTDMSSLEIVLQHVKYYIISNTGSKKSHMKNSCCRLLSGTIWSLTLIWFGHPIRTSCESVAVWLLAQNRKYCLVIGHRSKQGMLDDLHKPRSWEGSSS